MKLSKIKQFIISHWPLVAIFLVVIVFFWKFILQGLLPIPSDTIVGMYHPWRDVVWDGLEAGVPFKNFLITDPVRQQFPWRQLAIESLKNKKLPQWNPYSLSGTPLLANFQSAPFYIFNLLFFLIDFEIAWGILILLQPLLAGIFMYFYLVNLKLKRTACLLGAILFSFSGFFIVWLEWGTVLHSALWLPLILLATNRILETKKTKLWGLIFIFALTQSFFAGHLQVFFYVFLFSFIYLLWRVRQTKGGFKKLLPFIIFYLLFIIFTSFQWRPTLEFIRLSAREVDQADWQKPGWFLPWQHLLQFLAPDFFGNPTTMNYWGVWNYAEFIGFIGVIPLLLASFAFFQRRKVTFFFILGFLALSFALPTPWAKLVYHWRLPLFSTSQPTRLLLIVDFCLAILAAYGLDSFEKKKRTWRVLTPLVVIYGLIWLFVFAAPKTWPNASWLANLEVSKRNLILPTAMLFSGGGLMVLAMIWRKNFIKKIVMFLLLVLVCFDLIRFGWKFTPFVKKDWLFPLTETISFLKKDESIFRIMSTDRRIMPPNFSISYKLQDVSGYDPLYLLRYGELISVSERGKPDIKPPFGFNRIITPQRVNSRIINLLNVKYILSFEDLNSSDFGLVFKEGKTKVYYNKDFLPRTFMVYNYRLARNKQRQIELLMDDEINLKKVVILEETFPAETMTLTNEDIKNSAVIEDYQSKRVVIEVRTEKKGILVFTDSFYPGWRATVDNEETKIYRANYNFRAIIVPFGIHQVVFEYGH